ncbi:uncharacterized protein LOC110640368 isoform X1 [Hevea brasiliensis]|uniref:uncharacterized protein LOC110640368 isoform X1 n=1 Tax=Hevea brasiliensis TaxID=3981 RepID=UPI0025EE51FB|nr:uncharacterized protein LOC110640368 isoform X1 [Hevea brasiliensis]
MATSFAPVSISGGSQLKADELWSSKSNSFAKKSKLAVQRKSNQVGNRKLSVRAEYKYVVLVSFLYNGHPNKLYEKSIENHGNLDTSDGSRGGGSDFVAGFLLGGAIFGTLAYIFAPQIRRSLLNEDEYGFRRAKRPIYYDEGLEKTRQTLNAKISQLNSAIDNVSSRLRGGNNSPTVPVETDPEVEATM